MSSFDTRISDVVLVSISSSEALYLAPLILQREKEERDQLVKELMNGDLLEN